MNVVLSNLYEKIIAKVAADVPELWVDIDTGQLDEQAPPVQFPCLLVDFTAQDFTQMQFYQDANSTIRFKIGTKRVANSSGITPTPVLEESLYPYELQQKVYKAFQYWNADGMLANDMQRQSAGSVESNPGMKVLFIDFKFAYVDDTAG